MNYASEKSKKKFINMINFFRAEVFVLTFLFSSILGNYLGYLFFLSLPLSYLISLSLIFMSLTLLGKKIIIPENGLVPFSLILFLSFSALSLIWTPSVDIGQIKIVKLILTTTVLYFISSINFKKDEYMNAFILIILIITLQLIFNGHSLDLFNSIFFGARMLIDEGYTTNYGYLFSFLSLIIIYLYFLGNLRLKNLLLFPLVFFLLLSFFSGNRGSILSLFLGTITMLFTSRDNFNFSLRTVTGIIGFLLFFAFISTNYDGLGIIFNKRVTDIGSLFSIQERIIHFNLALDILSNSSFLELLFGHGISSYGYIISGYEIRLYPHNILLEVLIENGFIGTLFLLSAFIFSILNVNRIKVFNKNFYVFFMSFFIFLFTRSLSSGSLDENFLIFGLLLITCYDRKFHHE